MKRDAAPSYPRGAILDGKFRVERVLGAGGMGVVLEATHLTLGQSVAIKLLHDGSEEGSDTHRRFVQEAKVASGLVSDNVVRVFDLGRTAEGAPYIVMELLRGQDLAAVVAAESPLPVARAVDLTLGACQGMAAAHAAGLVHRDLKPANLFLAVKADGSRVVKVVDFGLSKVLDPESPALTTSASSFGTAQYMAPEQIASTKHVDARCDQHALAMVLFELLTARPPYEGPTAAAIVVKIATHPPPSARDLRREVPAGLAEAIQRALAKLPDDRFEDLGAFACAIAPFGGAASVRMAAAVQSTLAPTARARLGRRAAVDVDGDATTIPVGARPAGVADSTDGLSSSVRRWQTRRSIGVGVAAAVGVASLGLALVVGLRSGASTSAPSSSSPASSPFEVASSTPAVPPVAPAEGAEVAAPAAPGVGATTSPSAEVSAVPAPSSASAPTNRRPPRGAPKRPPAAPRDPEDVFGERRKDGRR